MVQSSSYIRSIPTSGTYAQMDGTNGIYLVSSNLTKTNINMDGSAKFAGTIDVASNQLLNSGARVREFGMLQVRRDGATGNSIEVYKDGNGSGDITASVSNTGSAYFAANGRFGGAQDVGAALAVKSYGSNNNYLGYDENAVARIIMNANTDGGAIYLRDSSNADSIQLSGSTGVITANGYSFANLTEL